ncbi:MAG TPA: ROK family transcriptional regulator [Selenomonadales bacterium]|nr:ROK family transcriptional regulator [Selenomonadales bacterium]
MQELMTAGGRPGYSTNEGTVINAVRRYGPVSRADVAKLTGLTPPTVTNITGKFLDMGLISKYRIGESSGGRRPLLLKINSGLSQLIIVNVRSEKMMGYVIDPGLCVHYEESENIKGLKEDEVLALLLDMIGRCRQAATVPVPAIGVVVRGPVRPEGIVVFALNIGWKNLPLKCIIEEKFQLPAFIENDAKALSNGEYYYGSVKDAGSMILLKVSHGIGAGIMFNGRLYRGINNSAGEVGHTTIDIGGPVCRCGNYGCLEALASEDALVEAVVKAVKEGQVSLIPSLAGGDVEQVTADIIYAAADAGDALALQSLSRVARYLGIGIANLVNTFNPELIVISGSIAKVSHHIADTLKQTVRDRAFESCSSVAEIRFSTASTANTLKGVADMLFAEITEPVWLSPR